MCLAVYGIMRVCGMVCVCVVYCDVCVVARCGVCVCVCVVTWCGVCVCTQARLCVRQTGECVGDSSHTL